LRNVILLEEVSMPVPIIHHGIRMWDRIDVDAAIEDLKEEPINTYDKAMKLK
jgi:hypothetical protein